MTDLSGRELDAAIARDVLGAGVRASDWYWKRPGELWWTPLPFFHRDLNAIDEHCGPWLRDGRYTVELRWSPASVAHASVYRAVSPAVRASVTADTPAMALARAIHAAGMVSGGRAND